MSYRTDRIERLALVKNIHRAAVVTFPEAGPVPDRKDAEEYFANWYRLMQRHDPRLQALSWMQIHRVLNGGSL